MKKVIIKRTENVAISSATSYNAKSKSFQFLARHPQPLVFSAALTLSHSFIARKSLLLLLCFVTVAVGIGVVR